MKQVIEKNLRVKLGLLKNKYRICLKKNIRLTNTYTQIDQIVQHWRKRNFASQKTYVQQHSLTQSGLPFLRAQLTYRKISPF